MTSCDLTHSPGPTTDLADSLDVRLMLAGRLSVVTIPLRRDRAELAIALGRAQEPRAERLSDSDQGADHRKTA